MAGGYKRAIARIGAKLLLAAAPFAGVLIFTGLSAHTPSPTAPAPTINPATVPAVTTPSAVAKLMPVAAQASRGYQVRRVLQVDGPLEHGDYAWDDAGVPEGELLITVDLKAQTLSVFRAGYEIGVAVILYGADDKQSPVGTFPITQKDKDHVSNLYDAPMPYMMRLTSDGVAIHGADVEWGKATHGCIGVPVEFAKLLFAAARLGDRVIITDGKMMDLSGIAPAA